MDNKKEVSQEASTTDIELEERKKKIIVFLKQKTDWIYYLVLSFLVFLTVYLRTRNLPRLKDIATGTWTLGPDLDPFLFLRWAQDIVKNGTLMVHDSMRYVPLGYDTSGEMKLLAYMIDWFYHGLSFFVKDATVTYAAILFPVFMAALTAISFFLFAKVIFEKEDNHTKNIIAIIATLLFILVPSLLPRTIAGIPEKESAAFFFMFMTFYFFIKAFNSDKIKNGIIFSLLAGISTAAMGLIWGGIIFIFFTIPPAVFVAFILGKVDKNKLLVYGIWIVSSNSIMLPFSTRYSLANIIASLSTGLAVGVFVIISCYLFMAKNETVEKIRKKYNFPKELFLIISSILILILLIIIFLGPNFIINQLKEIKSSLISPTTSRFGVTVAENKQPYFNSDWMGSFGPIKFGIPLYFWLFFCGTVVLFNRLIKSLEKKERKILTVSYLIFLFSLIFSRYAPNSQLNGTNGLSITVYFGGCIFFMLSVGYFYYKRAKEEKLDTLKEFNFSYILYFIMLTLGIIGARGGIRLIMVLGAVSPIAIAFLTVMISKKYLGEKEESMKFFIGILAIIIILSLSFTISAYYNEVKITSENFAPGPYQWQWQEAMSWVRGNTSNNAVFAHWWDYGYWVQSIGERATILDGGNAITYWNYMMGRYVLTGTENNEALEYLYTHNGTHLLIDSTDIGKYTAFSSIGSDKDYDRFSWISTFLLDDKQTQETKNETVYVYLGGFMLDEDLTWEIDGKEIFLPKRNAGVGAIVLRTNNKNNTFTQPEGIFVYNGKQYRIPLRYVYVDNILHDFEKGLDAGVFVFPRLDVLPDGRAKLNNGGALMYLSKRTVHSNLANLYLFNKKSEYFKLVHSEDSFFIKNLRSQGLNASEFVYYQGIQGPIKIWEIKYPQNIKSNPDYLKTEYPKEILFVKEGEYN